MRVEKIFRQNLSRIPDISHQYYLVAVSGGVDSMVLAELMRRSGLRFGLAHCNFGLRGRESDADEQWVRDYAHKHKLRLHVQRCPVEPGRNIQLEARRLRYAFFDQLMQTHGYSVLLTAHHADDAIESFFINLLRGTGIRGLTGIGEKPHIRRPLSGLFRREIEDFARREGITWREDSSNLSNKYLRNRIRHRLIPLLEELSPGFKQKMTGTMDLLGMSAAAQRAWFENLRSTLLHRDDSGEWVNVNQLPPGPLNRLFLHEWLTPHDFTDRDAIYRLLEAGTSKKVFNATGTKLIIRQGHRLLLMDSPESRATEFRFESLQGMHIPFVEWEMISPDQARTENFCQAPPHTAYVDAGKLQPPFVWRPWHPGDRFVPLGMKGTKKVGDFLTDMRIPVPLRKNIYLFVSNNTPVWLVGYRIDARFAIDEHTQQVLRLRLKD